MEPTALQQIVTLASSHGWLPLVMLLTLLGRKWMSPASGFPVTIPPRWLPVVSSTGGLVFGFETSLHAGQAWATALLSAAVMAGSTGFLDALMTAIFDHDNAPKWARAIVGIFDDITGKGGGGVAGTRLAGGKAFSAPIVIPKDPSASLTVMSSARSGGSFTAGRLVSRLLASMLFAVIAIGTFAVTGSTGCTKDQWAAFVTNSGQFMSYVLEAMQTIEQLWALVAPFIPASASAEATAVYNDTFAALNAANTTYQDAVAAGTALQQAPANIAQLQAAVQSAFAAWVAVVEKYQPIGSSISPKFGSTQSLVAHQAQQIANWK